MLDTLVLSTGVVALAEIGDKTQLLSILLAARFGRPVPILLGILAATVLNHALAALLGVVLAGQVDPALAQILVGVSFLLVGAWTLVPDSAGDERLRAQGAGVFIATFIAFMIAETGDKTQVATSLLAARHQDIATVVAGSTLGMLAANIPAVLLGEKLLRRLPLTLVRRIAAAVFLLLGLLALLPQATALLAH